MIEREPTFEDDKIRTWSFDPKDREPSQFESDPTLMQVDVDREEIYESRTYRFQTTPEVLAYPVQVATSRLAGTGARLTEIIPFARKLLDDTTFRFIAESVSRVCASTDPRERRLDISAASLRTAWR